MNPVNSTHQATRRLLLGLKAGEVITASQLRAIGVSARLTSYLKQNAVLRQLGVGAYVKGEEKPSFVSAVQAINSLTKVPIYFGGRSALDIFGVSQYLSLGAGGAAWLFSSAKVKLPKWFMSGVWDVQPKLVQTHFLASKLNHSIRTKEVDGFTVQVASRERAILEAIYLIGKWHRFEEIDELFESLTTLDGKHIQNLLENCNSIRVCRIFLFLAQKHGHPWLRDIDEFKVSLGRGKRVVIKNGRLDARYQITVPQMEEEPDV